MKNITALIMAGKNDSRMKSKKTQFAQTIYGKEVIKRVVETVKKAGIEDVAVIVGKDTKDEIVEVLKNDVKYIYQEESLGTGHAIMQSIQYLKDKEGKVLIINGNVPLVKPETIKKMIKKAEKEGDKATILTALSQNPIGYGRIIRDGNNILKIVEEADLQEEQKNILEINAGVYVFDILEIINTVKKLQKNNIGLYYLTDVIGMMSVQGLKIGAILLEDNTETLALTNKVQLEILNRILRIRINTMHMENGVTIEDLNSTYIYDDVKIGIDTIIRPNTTIKSGVVIGENCDIGPNAYIRENCKLADKVKVGSFVEIKKAIIDEGSKVPHLSYMGDCQIGKMVNIGCGTITCNYDGTNKHQTIIGDDSFIGSNVNLVAPVKIGDNVLVAAGSTITDDVPSDSLAIARQRQIVKKDWNKFPPA